MTILQTSKTSPFINETGKIFSYKTSNNTPTSRDNTDLVYAALPYNIDIFEEITENLLALEGSVVINQTYQILKYFYSALQKANENTIICNYIPRLHVVQQENKSVLIEWDFQNVRLGFVLEPVESESYFYTVFQDNEGSFSSDTRRLNNNVPQIISNMVKCVLSYNSYTVGYFRR
jgi:hypothetical protein